MADRDDDLIREVLREAEHLARDGLLTEQQQEEAPAVLGAQPATDEPHDLPVWLTLAANTDSAPTDRERFDAEMGDWGTSVSEPSHWKTDQALVRGRHFTEWVETIKQLKREKRYIAALLLLAECQQATLQDSPTRPAPWYFEQEAIIQRKEGRPWAEKAALERYLRSAEEPRPRIVERYAKLTQKQSN